MSLAALATLIRFAFATVSILITLVCGFLSLLLPASRSRRVLQWACVVEIVAFVAWVTLGTAGCEPECDPAEDLVSTIVLVAGPGILLALTLIAALLTRLKESD